MQVAAADPQVATRLEAFRRQVRRLHGWRASRLGALRSALLAAGPAAVVAVFWPELRWHAALVWLAAVGCGALLSRLLTRQRLSTAWLAGLRTPPRGIADAFATWLEVGGAASDPMVQWLASDLDARVRTLSAPQLAGVGRRRAFDRRWLMFAVLAVLLAWLLAWWLAPNWPGALGGRPQPPPPPPVAGGGAGAGAPQDPSSGGPQPQPQHPQPEPPEPVLDLPEDQRFVVPQFVADGPSRKERVRAAEIPEHGGAAAAPRTAGGRGGLPKPTPEEFARAAENAQRARHVAPHEQAIVRRFFTLLQAAGEAEGK